MPQTGKIVLANITLTLYSHEKKLTNCQLFFMAGDESLSWHPLLSDFILIAKKLEQLGFTYYEGSVTIIDPEEVR